MEPSHDLLSACSWGGTSNLTRRRQWAQPRGQLLVDGGRARAGPGFSCSLTSLELVGLRFTPLIGGRGTVVVATNKSKGVNSGHALASERVCQTQELSVLGILVLTSERVCQTRELRATKVNYLLYINE